MKRALLILAASMTLFIALFWIADLDIASSLTESTASNHSLPDIGHYILKNHGKVPMAAEEPNDWFMRQRNYPDNQAVSFQYYKAVEKARLDKVRFARSPNAPQWELEGPMNVHGRVSDISADPSNSDIVYTATASGGVFKSTDGGQNWYCVTDDLGLTSMGAVAVAPSDPNVVYIGGGEANIRNYSYEGSGMYRSNDGGQTWTQIGLTESGRISRIRVHPTSPDTLFVAVLGSYYSSSRTEYGVYRSYDGGATWDWVLSDEGCIDLAYNPNGVLLAAIWDVPFGPISGIFRSTDYGDNWARLGVPEGLPGENFNANRIGVTLDPVTGTAYALYAESDGDFFAIFKSTDNGASWVNLNASALATLNAGHQYGWYFGQVHTAPGAPDRVFVGGLNWFRSIDGGGKLGVTWWSDCHQPDRGSRFHSR